MQQPPHQDRTKSLETMVVLALALLAGNIILKKDAWLYAAAGLLGFSLLFKRWTLIAADLWIRFSLVLGRIFQFVWLAAVFYFILTPIALVYKLFSKNPLRLKKLKIESYFQTRDHVFGGRDLEKLW